MTISTCQRRSRVCSLFPRALLLAAIYTLPATCRWLRAESIGPAWGLSQGDEQQVQESALDQDVATVKEYRDTYISWQFAQCINGVVGRPDAFLHRVTYLKDDPNPDWPYLLGWMEIHKTKDCKDDMPEIFKVEADNNFLFNPKPEPIVWDPKYQDSQPPSRAHSHAYKQLYDQTIADDLDDLPVIQELDEPVDPEYDDDDNIEVDTDNQMEEESFSPLQSEQVQNYKDLFQPDIPTDLYTVLEVNLYERGFRFGEDTSMRLVSLVNFKHPIAGNEFNFE